MEAAGPPIEAADDDHTAAAQRPLSLAWLAGRPRSGALSTRTPLPWSRGSSDLRALASAPKKEGGRSDDVASSLVSSSSAAAPGPPATRKVDMGRRRGRGGGDGITEVVRAGGTAIYNAAYRGVLAAGKVVAVMDLFNHKPM